MRDLLALIPGYDSYATADPTDYFDEEAAQFAIDFFAECLVLVEGHASGEPFVLSPWQAAITAALWGWRRADGSRRYREAFIYVPRKNSKTAFAAGLLCLELFTSDEMGAQCYAAAASRDQSAHIFRFASQMIAQSPEMSSRAKVYKTYKSIEIPRTGATFRALSSEASTAHGLGPSFIIVDEVHAHKDGELIDTLITGTGARKSPLVIHITTADFDRPSICNQKYDYATKVRDGVLDDRAFLPVLYEAPLEADWTSPETWAIANPNLGVSVQLEYLERECQRAKDEPSYEGTFRRLHCNTRTQQEVRWLRLEDWAKCGGEIDVEKLRGKRCYGGLDLSSKIDLSAFVLIFPPDTDSDRYTILPRLFMPEDTARLRERADRVPYKEWSRLGYVTLTDGNVADYEAIKAQIFEDAAMFNIVEIGIDLWQANQLALELEAEGLNTTEVRPTFGHMSEASKELEKLIRSAKLQHGDNPALKHQASIIAIEEDNAGNIRPAKKAKGSAGQGRIDGMVAGIMALSRALGDKRKESVYKTRGALTW